MAAARPRMELAEHNQCRFHAAMHVNEWVGIECGGERLKLVVEYPCAQENVGLNRFE